MVIRATDEQGVFRPDEPADIADGVRVVNPLIDR